MVTAAPLNVVADNLAELNDLLADVAMGEGLAPLLVLVGTLLIVFSLGVFGVLTVGAVASLFTAD